MVLALVTFPLAARCVGAEKPTRPNIVFLLTDDQRWDSLGCMGNRIIKTPHVDRLAEGGTRFTNAFCTTSICAISRASFFTGQYERRHGIDNFAKGLSAAAWAQSFPALMRKQGYRTGFIGKWGVGRKLPAKEYDYWRGFAGQSRYFFKGDDKHLTDKHSAMALEFLDGCSADKPFCLQVSFKAAHCQDGQPWQTQFPPAKRYGQLYADVDIRLPKTARESSFRALPKFLQESEARRRWGVRFADEKMRQYTVKNYYRLITGVDDTVGRIVKKLKERDLAQNTVILFTSDNGFYLGEHGLAGKWFMHEESIRLPLIVYDPRAAGAARSPVREEMALNIDLAPTMLDLAGIKVPASMQGRSLLPLCRGEKPSDWREDFLYEHRFRHARIPASEGVRTARWKYVRYTGQQPAYEQLYDLDKDPHEQNNLAADANHQATLTGLRDRWRQLAAAAE